MKLKISTAKLQEMVSRSIKGAGNNKLIPLTSLMGIELKKKVLTLTTTDATNYLYISEEGVDGEDFTITISADTFYKLIARMTSETITLELKDNCLEVTGNGKYMIELPLDENSEPIKYPNPVKDFKTTKKTELKYSTIATILNSLKPSLSATLDIPCYTGYYVGERVVATDTYKIAALNEPVFKKAELISPEMMNLLSVMTAEKIYVDVKDNVIVFSTKDCVIYGNVMEGLDEYQIDDISTLIDTEFESRCKIAKSGFLQLLDRLSLFVGPYDKNAIVLTFTKDGLQVASKASNGVEVLPYIESDNFKDFICKIDIEMLATQVKSQAGDAIELYYGADMPIKMVDGNTTHIVALLEDTEEE